MRSANRTVDGALVGVRLIWVVPVLVLVSGLLAGGCVAVPVPAPGTLEHVSVYKETITPLGENQKIAVIPSTPAKSRSIEKCVSHSIGEIIGTERVVPLDDAYKSFYSIITSRHDLTKENINQGSVGAAIRTFYIKYLFVMGAPHRYTSEESQTILGLVLIFEETQYTTYRASIIDVEPVNSEDPIEEELIRVKASAPSGSFVVPPLLGIGHSPRETDLACSELGHRIGKALLSGKFEKFEKASTVDARAPEDDSEAR